MIRRRLRSDISLQLKIDLLSIRSVLRQFFHWIVCMSSGPILNVGLSIIYFEIEPAMVLFLYV